MMMVGAIMLLTISCSPYKYETVKGAANTVNFDPVTTKKVKLEVRQPDDNSAGLFEWEVR